MSRLVKFNLRSFSMVNVNSSQCLYVTLHSTSIALWANPYPPCGSIVTKFSWFASTIHYSRNYTPSNSSPPKIMRIGEGPWKQMPGAPANLNRSLLFRLTTLLYSHQIPCRNFDAGCHVTEVTWEVGHVVHCPRALLTTWLAIIG